MNGGQALAGYSSWNNDQLVNFPPGSNIEVMVPVIPSGKDKMVYIVEHNNNWVGIPHTAVYVNGKKADRFRTTWNNPFQRHNDGKLYCRYIAIRIPASMIKATDRFLALRIDMTFNTNQGLNIREIGTHDYN